MWSLATLLIVTMCLGVATAQALPLKVTGYGTSSGTLKLITDGVVGQFYIYPSPAFARDRVQSIYASNVWGENVEVGVDYGYQGVNQWRAFSTWLPENAQTDYEDWSMNYYPPEGQWIWFKLCRVTSPDTNNWNYYANGHYYGTWNTGRLHSAFCFMGAERYDGDSGGASLRYVEYIPYQGSGWSYWPASVLGYDNDNGYFWDDGNLNSSLHQVKVSHQ